MSFKLLMETALLLLLVQGIFGGLGYLTRVMPWIGLPMTAVLAWLVVRTASILRAEIREARKRDPAMSPTAIAVVVAGLWQVPGIATLPFGAPDWAAQIWQGTLLWIPAAGGWILPGATRAVGSWLWIASVLEAGLLVWLVSRPEPGTAITARPMEMRRASGEGQWAPARRAQEVALKREPQGNEKKR